MTTTTSTTTTENLDEYSELEYEGNEVDGYFGTLFVSNGEHPNGPYYDETEMELERCDTLDELRAEARGFLN
jgi:hypothetical protein